MAQSDIVQTAQNAICQDLGVSLHRGGGSQEVGGSCYVRNKRCWSLVKYSIGSKTIVSDSIFLPETADANKNKLVQNRESLRSSLVVVFFYKRHSLRMVARAGRSASTAGN